MHCFQKSWKQLTIFETEGLQQKSEFLAFISFKSEDLEILTLVCHSLPCSLMSLQLSGPMSVAISQQAVSPFLLHLLEKKVKYFITKAKK